MSAGMAGRACLLYNAPSTREGQHSGSCTVDPVSRIRSQLGAGKPEALTDSTPLMAFASLPVPFDFAEVHDLSHQSRQSYDYAGFPASQPNTPLPGNQVNNDFANHKGSIDALIAFVKLFTTSTGRILAAAAPNGADLTVYVATATTAAAAASGSATDAASSATAAAASATAAAGTAGSILGTSTTSVAIGTGSKSFTTQLGKNFGVGAWMTVASDASPTTNFMFGQVTAYNTGTGALTVNATSVGGSGTHTDWSISVSGIQGAQGVKGDTGSSGAGGTDATGTTKIWDGRIGDIPTGWLPKNGVAVSRSTYSDLFALLVKSHTFTVTVASPAVVSWASHGLDDGDPFVPTTTSALPTGLTTGVTYYVSAIGANSFNLVDAPGGNLINTSGTQSGTHTGVSARCAAWATARRPSTRLTGAAHRPSVTISWRGGCGRQPHVRK
jgi:hypothetical protein